MRKIAVIGLGIMGHGIADNFLKHGYDVTVWNRTASKADDLVAKGATLASSIADAVVASDIVFEVTANDESSRAIWTNDILPHARPEQYLVTCATLSVSWTDELARLCSEKGLTFFDLAMTGSRIGAESGQLILLAGGNRQNLNNIEADLAAIAKEVKYFGEAGSGMRYKLILNTLQAVHVAGFGEAMRMADEAGLDKKLVGDALAERPGGAVTNIARDFYLHDPDPITFSVEWIAKDLNYAADMSHTEHPLLDDVRAIYRHAIGQGYSQSDWTKINKL